VPTQQSSLQPKDPREIQAFTLIELLVVIAIIGALAALLMPTMSMARARGDGAQCLAHLRQIGVGLTAYMNDHDTFPGPLHAKQSATYQPNEPGSLAAMLENYLGANGTTTAGGLHFSPVFLCPAAYRKSQNKNITTYFVNMFVVPDSAQPVWGDIDQGQQPLSKLAIRNWADASNRGTVLNIPDMWALQDADQNYLQITNGFQTTTDNLLPLPAHEDHYNALFFDMHVAPRTANLVVSENKGTPTPPPSGP
jgi:prepilin-type N-terminal cleavage/methylation domain-containing protein